MTAEFITIFYVQYYDIEQVIEIRVYSIFVNLRHKVKKTRHTVICYKIIMKFDVDKIEKRDYHKYMEPI